MKTLSIIIPAYNEAARLPRTFELLKAAKDQGVFQDLPLEAIWVIDDGSKDETAQISRSATALLPEIRVHSVIPNQGKGNAIHEGLKQAASEWCLIADADSATPWDQFLKLKNACMNGNQNLAAIAMGSRDLPESKRNQRQSWIRENLGRIFNFAVRIITGLPFKDTQCGFKLIHRPSIQTILPRLHVKRFAWDVEFLMFAKAAHLKMLEIPVDWEHQEGSRISPLKDGIEMFLRVLQMRFRIWFTRFDS